MMKNVIALFGFLIAATALPANAHKVELDFFGEPKPDLTPIEFPFANHVPKGVTVGNPVFGPDGKEFYFTDNESRDIHVMTRSESGWSKPRRASFADQGDNYEPYLAADGLSLYFISTRAPGTPPYNGRIWHTSRASTNSPWQAPTLVLDRVTDAGFWYPNEGEKGVLYFGATLADSFGEGDFYRAKKSEDGWQIHHLPAPFNTEGYEWDPLISPDGSYMMFQSERAGGLGGTDIYVSFKTGEEWGTPINLGSTINTPEFETAGSITPDGKFMFYTLVPDEGAPRIYWVSTDVITRLQKGQDAKAD
ncbi:MAG: PD40 domain-containing protein [Alphaproteobacteria bacterium]|nr:PD40 domain-containing protein [Alphaproteobacteria bacterium]